MMSHFSNRYQQLGTTMVGVIVLGSLLAFWVLIIIKLTPVYLEGRAVSSIFEKYEQDYKSIGTDKRKVHGYFSRFFQVNSVFEVEPKLIEVTRGKKEVTVELNYEVRVPLVTDLETGNIDIVVKFDNKVTVPRVLASG